jgi:hypothetical protein
MANTLSKAIPLPSNVGSKFPFVFRSPKYSIATVIIALLEIPTGAKFNENVYGIDLTGNVLWQVPKKRYVYEDSPYTDIVRDGDNVVLFNWDGLQLTVEPKAGGVLREDYRR